MRRTTGISEGQLIAVFATEVRWAGLTLGRDSLNNKMNNQLPSMTKSKD